MLELERNTEAAEAVRHKAEEVGKVQRTVQQIMEESCRSFPWGCGLVQWGNEMHVRVYVHVWQCVCARAGFTCVQDSCYCIFSDWGIGAFVPWAPKIP